VAKRNPEGPLRRGRLWFDPTDPGAAANVANGASSSFVDRPISGRLAPKAAICVSPSVYGGHPVARDALAKSPRLGGSRLLAFASFQAFSTRKMPVKTLKDH
jgi:hypothetical protein